MDSLAVFTMAGLFFLYGIAGCKLQLTVVTGPIFFYAPIITLTVSIFLHGITAGTFSELYAARILKTDGSVEKKPVGHELFMQKDRQHAE